MSSRKPGGTGGGRGSNAPAACGSPVARAVAVAITAAGDRVRALKGRHPNKLNLFSRESKTVASTKGERREPHVAPTTICVTAAIHMPMRKEVSGEVASMPATLLNSMQGMSS